MFSSINCEIVSSAKGCDLQQCTYLHATITSIHSGDGDQGLDAELDNLPLGFVGLSTVSQRVKQARYFCARSR